MSRDDETDKAVTQLLSVDTKLGVLAGLALVAKKQQELQSEDEDAAGSPTDKPQRESSSRKSQRKRRGSVHSGDASDASGAAAADADVSSAVAVAAPTVAANKKYSVHDQRDAIRRLQEQNQILKQELAIESRDAKTMLCHEKRQQLSYLQTMAATFTRKIETVKRTVARVDELIVKRAHELEVLRQQQQQQQHHHANDSSKTSDGTSDTGAAVAAESTAASTRRVRALENRLELSLVKKNEMDSINKHLRAQIEKVRKDRVIFDGIYKKLEREMSEFRSRHELSVDELARATDAKQLVHVEIARIQTQAEHAQRVYEQQFYELKTSIETSMREAARLSGGAGVAGAASPLAHTASAFASKQSSDATDESSAHSTGSGGVHAKDSPLNRVSALSSWKIGYDRALAATNESAVAKYDKAFAGIKELTGIQDVAAIADAIVQRDDANFKRFKRVEELHEEEVTLQSQIDALTRQIEAFKSQEGIATSATQKQQCRALTEQLEHAVAKSKAFDNDYEDTTTTLTRIKSTVHSIHSMLAHANCARNVDKFSQGSAHLALGSHSARDVTDANVLEYLQAIETFTTSLMKETHDAAATAAAMDAGASGDSASTGEGHTTAASTPLLGSHVPGGGAGVRNLTTSSPIGHGPPTLPSDPAQKLRVHVPSFGGVNGVLIVPASSSMWSTDGSDGSASKPAQSPIKSLQQQQQHLHLHQGLQRRKSGGRFELMARKSLSQVQFVAALAAAAAANSDVPITSLHHPLPPSPSHMSTDSGSSYSHSHVGIGGLHTATDGSSGSSMGASSGIASSAATTAESQLTRVKLEEEEEERALTYDELRQFAAKNVVKRKSEAPATVAVAGVETPAAGAGAGAGAGVLERK